VNHSEIVSFLWGVADLIRDTFKRGKYQDVILPLTVLRRLDCVLAGTKEKVLAAQARFKGKLDDPGGQWCERAEGMSALTRICRRSCPVPSVGTYTNVPTFGIIGTCRPQLLPPIL
jgi:type I restriction enzyme M protein